MAPRTPEDEEIKSVQIDALVILQIMKQCRQQAPQPVTGQLLGLDVDTALQITHSFGYIQHVQDERPPWEREQRPLADSHEDGEQYQMDMLRRLREVNVDSNTVGWYQTTHLGQLFSETVIETQFFYQQQIPRSILLVYDPLQSRIGKPAFKALRLGSEFMTKYKETRETNKAALDMFASDGMFLEIPIHVSSSAMVESFLMDWSIMDPSATSNVETLDVENAAFTEKNMQLLINSLGELSEQQMKMQMFERNAGRGPDAKGKGKGRNAQPPRQLDTMMLSQQIQTYCKQINISAEDAFGKVFLLSNKPGGMNKPR